MKFSLFISLMCISLLGHSQDIKPEELLIIGDTLVFMGVDFGMVKLINTEDIGKAVMLRDKHGPYWGQMGNRLYQGNNLKFDFHKKLMVNKVAMFDSSFKALDSNWVVSDYPGASMDQIAHRVSLYPHIDGCNVGIAFIVDKMDKPKVLLTMYAVYIDLKDNSVIKVIKCGGIPGGYGYGMFWGQGVIDGYGNFVSTNQNYIQRLKHYFKKKG